MRFVIRMSRALGCLAVTVLLTGCASLGEGAVQMAGQPPRRLNNFVTELVSISDLSQDGTYEAPLSCSREGWLHFACDALTGRQGRLTVSVTPLEPGAAPVAVFTVVAGDGRRHEAMRYLRKGDYVLRMELKDVSLASFTARSVSAIIFANFPYPPHLQRFGRYDWAQLKEMGILDACNVMITNANGFHAMKQWLADGKQVLQQAGVPGLSIKVEGGVTAENAFTCWSEAPGMNRSDMSGIIADEFFPSLRKHFPAWVEAIKRLRAEKPDRVFYPYIAGDPKGLRGFVEPLRGSECVFAYERYLTEQPTEEKARKFIEDNLRGDVAEIEKYFPEFSKYCLFVMGFLNGPNESLNCDPSVDYKVYTDMQFNLLATDPSLDGLFGVEMYLSGYCDEEYMRWCGKLFRHYCVEGRTDRLSPDPYKLDHIANPDFEDGLNGWTVSAAAEGSVTTGKMAEYGWLQGRYPRVPNGDTFMILARKDDRENMVTQTIRNLTPGRFYSAKMITGDYDQLTRNEIHPVRIDVQGAERVPEEDILGSYANCYSHTSKKYGKQKTYFNYHRCVFRAAASTATLVISDQRSEAGRRWMVNFIEVEPYLMPDAFAGE